MKALSMKSPGFFERSELTAALWAFRREWMVVGLFSMVANVLMLAPTLYMLQVYDRVLVSRNELTLLVVSLMTVFLLAVMAFAEWSRSRLLVRAGVRFDDVLSSRVFHASFESNLSKTGTGAQRAFGDLTELRQFLTGNGIFAFFDTPWTPIYIAVLFLLHPFLGWVAIGFACVQAGLAWFGHRRAVQPAAELSRTQLEATQLMQDKLRNAEVIESMGMLEGLRRRWAQRHQAYMQQHAQTHGLQHRLSSWSKGVRYAQQSLSLAAGAILVIDGQLSPGAMIAANVLMTRALAPLDQLVGAWRGFLTAKGAFERLEALLAAYPPRDAALKRVPPTGEVVLRDVEATAPGRQSPILKGVSLHAQPGTVTVVMGPSGSGKSTLARVMMGIWPATRGEVWFDERPLQGWDRNELGPWLGYLPQDVELFEGSIAENIARFADIDSAQVIAAARSAGLHEMILRFPKGYDTPMGEAGSLLSGGQRQRIALARALYGDPPIVVLDEPNANLDDVGEAALMQALQGLRDRGKTVVMISHRPSALAVADQVIVLRDGRVAMQGPRDEVVAAMQATPTPARPAPTTVVQPLPAV
jgi:ATP-binding cassette, subfamily C, bacterial exporter for protease/lipase